MSNSNLGSSISGLSGTPFPSTQAPKQDKSSLVSVIGNTFYHKGQKVALDVLMMNLMIKRVKAVDGLLSSILQEMNGNNQEIAQMNEFLSGLRGIRSDSGGATTTRKMYDLIHDFNIKYKTDIIKKMGLKGFDANRFRASIFVAKHITTMRGDIVPGPNFYNANYLNPTKAQKTQINALIAHMDSEGIGGFAQSFIDERVESTKAKISGINSNQQMAQIKIEKYNNVRNEAMQLVSSIMKGMHESIQSTTRNIGT